MLWGFLQTEAGQNWLARQVTKRLSKDLQTRISIKHVRIGLFNFDKMDLEGVLVEDQKKDTLLYAGKFQVRITDWFIFKDKAELKYVGLEDASIFFNRTDSIWNYNFLEQYFKSTDTSTKKKAGIEFDLKKVVMKNVTFIKKDAWLGNDLIAKVGALDMDANQITVTQKTVDISNIALTDPYFSLLNYTGRYVRTSDPEKIEKEVKQAAREWSISFGKVSIKNGRFRNDKNNYTPNLAYFDGQHIDFSKINGTLKNIGWTADTISGNIDLSTVERSGLVVKSLKAKTTFHPQAMIFDELYLQTNRSTLTNYFSMRYEDIGHLDNFLHDVTLSANFENASISSDDIAFFAPELRTWKKNIRLNGDVRGTVDALASKDLEVWAGNNTYVHGAVSLVGLPNINETLINVEAKDLRTTYADAVSFIPAIRNITTPNLKRLTYLRFKGTYTGFINDFVSYGTLQTNLGTLVTDLNMKFPRNGEPVYTGELSTNGFQLGSFINSSRIGLVDFHGKVNGRGFKWQTLDMNIDGVVNRIQYDNYTYQNITAKGNFTNRLFKGLFIMKDPNADLDLRGEVDLTGAKPFFNVTANINRANLKQLQLTPNDIQLTGKFDLNLYASSWADLLGKATVSQATLVSNGKTLSFDTLMVSSTYENGRKNLNVFSKEFNAHISGDFDIQTLPSAFTVFLHRYYPSYIKAPRFVKPQVFDFQIRTELVDEYISLIDNRLSGFNNSTIEGSLDTRANNMRLTADVPQFKYSKYDFSGVHLDGKGTGDSLILEGTVANTFIGDSMAFPQTSFNIRASNDVSNITLATTSNQAINKADLSAQVKTFSDGVTVLFNPSTFVLNGKTWSIEQGGDLNFRRNSIVQGQVILRESNQEIRLSTQPDPVGNWNNLHIALEKLNIGDISPFLTRKNRFEGLLSGEIVVEDPQNRFNIRSNLHGEELWVDKDSIGQVVTSINYNNKTGMLTGQGSNQDPLHHIEFDLAMNFKDTANTFTDRINTRLTNFELKYLNRFLGTLFSDIQGYATGNFDIVGEGSNRDFLAKARIRDASFKVNFTQVRYTINDTEFELKKDRISLDGIRVRDRFGNTAVVKGSIKHQAFQNMEYDILVQTESRQMELLNTNYNDNQQFFGTAMGSGSFVLLGPQNDMLMDINLKASETDSSYITLPPSRTRESGQASFMVERKYGREMIAYTGGTASNLNYVIRLNATPLVNVGVILDDLTGDVIRGRGTGNLRITSGTSQPLTLQGRYNIDAGSYEFTFQALLKKPFLLRKGGNNYIEWNGDPYEATVHLDAVYTTPNKVSFAPLANTLFASSSLNVAGRRDYVSVLATLTGNLFHPDFTFKLDFPVYSDIYSRPEFTLALQQIQNNQNELNKQVTYLIVFNSFAPFENTASEGFGNPFGEFTYSTISGLLFGKVNQELNRVLSKVLKNNKATFNVTGSLYNRNMFDANSRNTIFRLPNQSNVGLSLGLPLFNERAQFTIGGTFDVPLGSDVQQNFRLFPDVQLELLVNKSGSVKATFFYRQNIDFLSGNTPASFIQGRYGASIGYGRDFNSLGELFGGKHKMKLKKKETQPAADSTGTN